ncbi:MAG: DUF1573 domain-containing protein [Saprospiraceae bacterium]|nr:DUF1573 domain-containing protein [Saprospiraceae bacterium]
MRFYSIFILVFLMACSQEKATEPVGIQETPAKGSIRNSDLIKIPATLSGTPDLSNLAKIEFDNTTHEFGEAQEGEIIKHTFSFKNTGEHPLVVTSARSSCGCTVPKWSREPIEPGKSGTLRIRFNTDTKPGEQIKTVTVTSNTEPADTKLFIKGFVHKRNP